MIYTCSKCGRWLQSRTRSLLYCPRCEKFYRKLYSYKPPIWKQHPDIEQTKKGIYYRLSNAKNGNTLILFHHYNWYPPTEKEILESKDKELIELYKKVDNENEELRYLDG